MDPWRTTLPKWPVLEKLIQHSTPATQALEEKVTGRSRTHREPGVAARAGGGSKAARGRPRGRGQHVGAREAARTRADLAAPAEGPGSRCACSGAVATPLDWAGKRASERHGRLPDATDGPYLHGTKLVKSLTRLALTVRLNRACQCRRLWVWPCLLVLLCVVSQNSCQSIFWRLFI